MIFIKSINGDYYGVGEGFTLTSGQLHICFGGYTIATVANIAEAQRVKDEIVAAIQKIYRLHDGNGVVAIKTDADGGIVIEVIIDDL
jgi:hypothetical protein